MSRTMLFTARAEALCASSAPTGAALDRTAADAAIEEAVRAHGVRGCAAEMAYEYGEHPEITMRRMRWALELVNALYGPAAVGERPPAS
ncbi:hypothetical protein SAMN05444365_103540 [Micromonospora pattaloongensis]|uniref:Uncharacterized protein n=1 Tax=Micromonospora pattaloongensis TaxID=405436 RepID=A0A1H3MV83_9ACTN|nr:hypothetical protein [Micromonospora pattaloongensis]SDY80607.1 hypothetical protein SAMN05444365_103540 [Micromonospora pattaloongensis]